MCCFVAWPNWYYEWPSSTCMQWAWCRNVNQLNSIVRLVYDFCFILSMLYIFNAIENLLNVPFFRLLPRFLFWMCSISNEMKKRKEPTTTMTAPITVRPNRFSLDSPQCLRRLFVRFCNVLFKSPWKNHCILLFHL